MDAILQDQPLPARLLPWPRALPTPLTRCLLLALLLHVWMVLMLGTAPGGTAAPGQGVGGAINITLRGPAAEGAATPGLPAVPAQPVAGQGTVPRWGGAARDEAPPAAGAPGAARLGETLPEPVVQPVPDASPALLMTPDPAPSPRPEPPLKALEPLPYPIPLPEPAALPRAALADAVPPVAAERRLDPTMRAAPAPVPPLATLAPFAPVALPSPPPVALPSPPPVALPPLPAPTALIAAPPLERPLNSPLLQPQAVPAPSGALPRTAVLEAPPELAPPPVPAEASPAVRSLQALPSPSSARTPEPVLARSPDAPAASVTPLPPIPGAHLPTARAGAPDAGTQIGHDVATPPAAAASAVPRLNLQLVRPRGGELSRYSTAGALPVMPRPPERDHKLAREIKNAGKADCAKAYASAGLLAVIPLAADALRQDGGCQW